MTAFFTIIFASMLTAFSCFAQDIPTNAEQQLEHLADINEAETEDDSYLQQLEYYKASPVNLNSADVHELRELGLLTDLQIDNLLSYRRIFGRFINIYELQAIPTWDIQTIRRLVPFISIESSVSFRNDFATRFKNGEHNLLFRISQIIEKQKGFQKSTNGTRYLGTPQRIFFRYRYQYKNQLQFGIVGDKDAGEQFFKGAQKLGFDFYSIHLFARKIGAIQSVALGDFTVNMGQGLILWQSLAFKKSADVMGIKRQSATLRPYNSAGEFNFKRGAGITIRKKKTELTAFGSLRKISANFVPGTSGAGDHVSSFQASGNHRTIPEVLDRNRLRQISFGANARYYGRRGQIGLNGVCYHLSVPFQKRAEPYNEFAWRGNYWRNMSIDYGYTLKNFHFFGEAAVDKNFNKAFLNGMLVSVDPKVDVSIVHRSLAKEYQAVNGNAFTENTSPSNESGLYMGVTVRPVSQWRVDLYGDFYKFPWLRYQADSPATGKDFLAQLTYTPNRQVEIYTRYRVERKYNNERASADPTKALVEVSKQNLRMHTAFKVTPGITIRNRVEVTWFHRGNEAEQGFLTFFDVIYRPLMTPFSGLVRCQYFETDSYDSRLYAYENDVLYGYSIPVFYNKGYRYYFTLNYDASKKLSFWWRWSQTIYRGSSKIGSGLDEIAGSRRTDVKVQVRYCF